MSEEVSACRICGGDGEDEPLCQPCKCQGSIRNVHESCLLRWLSSRGAGGNTCELCLFDFKFEPVYAPDAPAQLPRLEVARWIFKRIYSWIRRIFIFLVHAFFWTVTFPGCSGYAVFAALKYISGGGFETKFHAYQNEVSLFDALLIPGAGGVVVVGTGFIVCGLGVALLSFWARALETEDAEDDFFERQVNPLPGNNNYGVWSFLAAFYVNLAALTVFLIVPYFLGSFIKPGPPPLLSLREDLLNLVIGSIPLAAIACIFAWRQASVAVLFILKTVIEAFLIALPAMTACAALLWCFVDGQVVEDVVTEMGLIAIPASIFSGVALVLWPLKLAARVCAETMNMQASQLIGTSRTFGIFFASADYDDISLATKFADSAVTSVIGLAVVFLSIWPAVNCAHAVLEEFPGAINPSEDRKAENSLALPLEIICMQIFLPWLLKIPRSPLWLRRWALFFAKILGLGSFFDPAGNGRDRIWLAFPLFFSALSFGYLVALTVPLTVGRTVCLLFLSSDDWDDDALAFMLGSFCCLVFLHGIFKLCEVNISLPWSRFSIGVASLAVLAVYALWILPVLLGHLVFTIGLYPWSEAPPVHRLLVPAWIAGMLGLKVVIILKPVELIAAQDLLNSDKHLEFARELFPVIRVWWLHAFLPSLLGWLIGYEKQAPVLFALLRGLVQWVLPWATWKYQTLTKDLFDQRYLVNTRLLNNNIFQT